MADGRSAGEPGVLDDRGLALVRIALDAPSPAPPPLGPSMLHAALAHRPAGRWAGFDDGDQIDPTESLGRAVAHFDQLVAGLDAAGWQAAVVTYGTVKDLVAHLVAIETYVQAQLGLDPDAALEMAAGHVELGAAVIERWRPEPPSSVLAEWRSRTGEVLDGLRSGRVALDGPASWHGAPVDVRALCIIRTFELWTHADDVRVGLGAAPSAPDNAQLRLMTDFAADVLPLALALTGRERPGQTLRLVLTGRGGGTWRRSLQAGEAAGDTDDLVIVADAIGFCRLAANRCSPDELAAHVDGDPQLARDVLVAMTALAAD